MSDTEATPTTPAPAPTRRRSRKQEKKSLWQMDLSSIGKKDDAEAFEDRIERPPFEPTLPQVNLLPQQVRDSMTMGRIRNRSIAAIAALLVIVGGLWWMQGSTIERAEADLAAATAENTRLRDDVAALAPVKQMYEQITRLQEIVTTTLASNPQARVVIERLSEAGTAAGVGDIAFSIVDVTYGGIPTPGEEVNRCPNPDPFGTDITVGCLTFQANAANRDQVAALLRALEADPLFVGPFVSSTLATEVAAGPEGNRTEKVVQFTGTAGLSLEALETLLTPEQVEAILTPPKPEETPEESPAADGEES